MLTAEQLLKHQRHIEALVEFIETHGAITTYKFEQSDYHLGSKLSFYTDNIRTVEVKSKKVNN